MITQLSQETVEEYGSDATTIDKPIGSSYSNGAQVGKTVPAKWWNWLFNAVFKRLISARSDANNMLTELQNVVTDSGATLNPSVNTQLSTAVDTKADKKLHEYIGLYIKGFLTRKLPLGTFTPAHSSLFDIPDPGVYLSYGILPVVCGNNPDNIYLNVTGTSTVDRYQRKHSSDGGKTWEDGTSQGDVTDWHYEKNGYYIRIGFINDPIQTVTRFAYISITKDSTTTYSRYVDGCRFSGALETASGFLFTFQQMPGTDADSDRVFRWSSDSPGTVTVVDGIHTGNWGSDQNLTVLSSTSAIINGYVTRDGGSTFNAVSSYPTGISASNSRLLELVGKGKYLLFSTGTGSNFKAKVYISSSSASYGTDSWTESTSFNSIMQGADSYEIMECTLYNNHSNPVTLVQLPALISLKVAATVGSTRYEVQVFSVDNGQNFRFINTEGSLQDNADYFIEGRAFDKFITGRKVPYDTTFYTTEYKATRNFSTYESIPQTLQLDGSEYLITQIGVSLINVGTGNKPITLLVSASTTYNSSSMYNIHTGYNPGFGIKAVSPICTCYENDVFNNNENVMVAFVKNMTTSGRDKYFVMKEFGVWEESDCFHVSDFGNNIRGNSIYLWRFELNGVIGGDRTRAMMNPVFDYSTQSSTYKVLNATPKVTTNSVNYVSGNKLYLI